MIAEVGKRYAIIQGGRCHWKFDITTLPEWHDELQVVDITGVTPEPEEGDIFDGTSFSKPVVSQVAERVRQPGARELIRALIKRGVITQQDVDDELRV